MKNLNGNSPEYDGFDIYVVESTFILPVFYKFSDKINSLRRFWIRSQILFNEDFLQQLNKKNNLESELLSEKDSIPDFIDVEELIENQQETLNEELNFDQQYFVQHIRASVIVFALSLFEDVLKNVANGVAEELKITLQINEGNNSTINKYLEWLRLYNLNVNLTESEKQKIDLIRKIRNNFIHSINAKLPYYLQNALNDLFKDYSKEGSITSDNMVEKTLVVVSNIVKKIELEYIEFSSSR
jgi:hypothetical protein